MLVRDSKGRGIESIESFPVLLQPMHVFYDIISFFGMCLSQGAMDSSSCLMAALLMDGDQALLHGVGSVAMGDVNELIASDAFPNKDFGESVVEEPGLGIIGVH